MDQRVNQAIANNDAFRDAIVAQAMPMQQPLPSQSVAGTVTTANQTLVFQPKLTGLLLGFLIQVNGTVTNTGAGAGARTNFGSWNALTRIQFTDPTNFTRVNTTGWHLASLNSMKSARAFGGAVAPNLPNDCGNINTVNSLAATIAATTGSEAYQQFYYVPVAYSPTDLRGAIYSQIINATAQLQVTLNATPSSITADELNAMYNGANTICLNTAVTVRVTQVYYDQLPRQGGVPLLPIVDLSTMYILQDTTQGALIASQDNPVPFANFRTYLSTLAVYDNAGVYNLGTDVTYWALAYANGLRQFQKRPAEVFLDARNQVGFDLPGASYFFDHRAFPISTANYGNCELVLQPSAVTSGAFIALGYEMFAQQQSIVTATSLP